MNRPRSAFDGKIIVFCNRCNKRMHRNTATNARRWKYGPGTNCRMHCTCGAVQIINTFNPLDY